MGQSELTGWKLITESEQFFVKIAANLNGTKIAAQFFYLLTLIFVDQTIWNNFLLHEAKSSYLSLYIRW